MGNVCGTWAFGVGHVIEIKNRDLGSRSFYTFVASIWRVIVEADNNKRVG